MTGLKISIAIIVFFILTLLISALNMWSISAKLLDFSLFEKHFLSLLLSFLSFSVGSVLGRIFRKFLTVGFIITFASFILLFLVELKGVTAYGAKRWLSIGDLTIQPTEIAKVGLALLASEFVNRRKRGSLLLLFLITVIPSILIVRQPDYSSALAVFSIFLVAMYFTISAKPLIVCAILVFASIPLIWEFGLREYHRERIKAILNPEKEFYGAGYQTIQSKIAIGMGGIYGAGFAKGAHSSGKWIPNLHSDFAFVSIAEDFGLVGTIMTLIIVFGLIFSIFAKALFTEQKIAGSLCSIVGAIITIHVVINLLVVSGLFPVMGIPFTFISYGGTHNVSMAFLIGICTGIPEPKKEIKIET